MKKRLIIAVSVLLLIGCSVHHHVAKPVPIHYLLAQSAQTVYRIQTKVTLKPAEDAAEGRQLVILGNAFAIGKNRLLTVEHLTTIDYETVYYNIGMTVHLPILPENKAKSETYLILEDGTNVPATVIYKNSNLDFAILGIKGKTLMPFYSIGNSDDLNSLDNIFMISNSERGEYVKPGSIMQLDWIEYDENYKACGCNNDLFGIYLNIQMGNSGSPIFKVSDGRVEVVGLVSLGDMTGSGYGIKINSIMNDFRNWQNEKEL